MLSTCNKKPSSYHRILADIIKSELNGDLLKSQYEKRLRLYKDVSLLNRGMLISSEDKKTDSDSEILLREIVFDDPEVVIEITNRDNLLGDQMF